jgi:LIM domain
VIFLAFQCHSCLNPIADQGVSACGQAWHIDHFVCTVCKTNLNTIAADSDGSSHYFEVDGLPYCASDYWTKFGVKCAGMASPSVSFFAVTAALCRDEQDVVMSSRIAWCTLSDRRGMRSAKRSMFSAVLS